ncbi:MAG TPA: excinuclease ABC subunit UvrB [Verrucomicrobiota bacterium]|nr:excinuclease ABC subunit B [Verrucomicrobiales bacterium]HRI12374.1 excinuclease ABC subunit UvrB [Verrucomicrobiota bacterium]
MARSFELVSSYAPAGDQPAAIAKLNEGLLRGAKHQVLLGVTGSGKTFTMANVIAKLNRPTLILSHNKTLAAQLYAEFKGFFPHNAVEYFVSYFDYYQPEAYIPRTDTFIEKDSSVNDEIERLRLSAMSSLLSRRDVVVVASVSCIYGIGDRTDYEAMVIPLRRGQQIARNHLLERLVDLQFSRNDYEVQRGKFRVRGDVIELQPAYAEDAIRIEFFGDELERFTRFDPLTGETLEALDGFNVFPSKQFATPQEKINRALLTIRAELTERIAWFEKQGKLLEAQRIKMRCEFDLEQLQEMGFCSGIENYSRHITGRPPGSRPGVLLDFFPEDFLVIVDESHATLPQIQGMHAGDLARKTVLVDHGFRLPSALDNRPLSFDEFRSLVKQAVYVSATPGPVELTWAGPSNVAEQIVRPTGLVDPEVIIKPLKGQIDDLIEEARQRVDRKERVLVTTLTKRTAEELTDYLRDLAINVRYLHSEIDAIERVEILRALRKGDCDVLVGINLLREGLDLPEVSLVAILDADKEGYLRSATSLIQTAGRGARHVNGKVILYADVRTQSIEKFLAVSEYRRNKQKAYNEAHQITPRSVVRAIESSLGSQPNGRMAAAAALHESVEQFDVTETLRELEQEMLEAASNLEFEKAALLRDQVNELRHRQSGAGGTPAAVVRTVRYGTPPRGRGRGRRSH